MEQTTNGGGYIKNSKRFSLWNRMSTSASQQKIPNSFRKERFPTSVLMEKELENLTLESKATTPRGKRMMPKTPDRDNSPSPTSENISSQSPVPSGSNRRSMKARKGSVCEDPKPALVNGTPGVDGSIFNDRRQRSRSLCATQLKADCQVTRGMCFSSTLVIPELIS